MQDYAPTPRGSTQLWSSRHRRSALRSEAGTTADPQYNRTNDDWGSGMHHSPLKMGLEPLPCPHMTTVSLCHQFTTHSTSFPSPSCLGAWLASQAGPWGLPGAGSILARVPRLKLT